MKRRLIFLLTFVIALLSFAGCKPSEDKKADDGAQIETAQSEEKSTEVEEKTEDKAGEETADTRKVFVTAEEAKAMLDAKPEKFVAAEVTWGEAKDSADYLTAHIPGAIHINTDTIEEGPVWNYRSADEVKKSLEDYGITKDTTVLLYGPNTGVDRVALCYLWAGVKKVYIIDGGLGAWKDAGFETESTENAPVAVNDFGAEVPAHPEYILSLDQVKEKLSDDNFKLVSIRSEAEWLGETSGYSYIPKAGEPKGAVWGKSGEGNSGMEFYVDEKNKNKDFSEIENMWKEQGFSTDNELSFYCGTGWRAALPWLMCYERNIPATLFDGGWNEWQMNDDLDVQVGDPKSDTCQFVKVKDLSNDKAAK